MAREAFINIKLDDPPASTVELVGISTGGSGSGSGDKHFSQPFTNQSSITVNHDLGKKPAVFVEDTAGDEVGVVPNHQSVNQLTIEMNHATSGTVYCN